MAESNSDCLRILVKSGQDVVRLQKMTESDVDCLRIPTKGNQVAA